MRIMIPFLLVSVAALAGCSKADSSDKPGSASSSGGASAGGGAPAAASPEVDAVIDGWKKAGLTVSAFDVADGDKLGGGACKAGSVNGVDATVCSYASPEAATAAKAKGLEAVGETTGAAITRGALLLVIADRHKSDPEGRTINQATQLFVGKK